MAQCLKDGKACPLFYECKEEGLSGSGKGWQTLELDGKRIIKCRPGKARGERTMQQFCYYCLGTVSGRKIGHKASWTGRTPTWCPRGRDEEKEKRA